MKVTARISFAGPLTVMLFFISVALTRGLEQQKPATAAPQSEQETQLAVPNRPQAPLYQGEQGAQGSEIIFVPPTRTGNDQISR